MRRIGSKSLLKRPSTVAKIRRTKVQAYGNYWDWLNTRKRIILRDNNRCRLCGSTSNLQVDHIIPISRGGKTVDSNLWTLCDICHSRRPHHKKAKHLILHKK